MDALLPGTGKWRPDILAAKFKLGDLVEMSYREIAPIFDEQARFLQRFELEKIRLMRAPNGDELAAAVASRAWREPGNLLPVPAVTGETARRSETIVAGPAETQVFERARDTNLKRLDNMPNFTADETATRYTAASASQRWELLDVIKSEITTQGFAESREHVRQNDNPVPGGIRDLRAFGAGWRGRIRWNWGGSYNGRLRSLFNPACPVTFRFVRRLAVRGMQLVEFDFDAPADSCFASWGGALRYYAPLTGKMLVEEGTGELVQLNDVMVGFPSDFAWARVERETNWDRVKFDDAQHLLPVSASQVVHFSNGHVEVIQIQYANHHHFNAKSNISFQ